MPDLSELLATEARRHEPTSVPPFEELLRERRVRDRQGRIAAGSLLVAVVAGVALVPAVVDGQRPSTRSVVVVPGSAATVTGLLRSSGGPVGAGQSGFRGVIVFESTTGQTTTTTTGSDGTFTITVKPGTYTVAGTSPQYSDGQGTCRATDPVTVSPTGLTGVTVVCPMRTPVSGATTLGAGQETIPPAVLNVVRGFRAEDLTSPVEWVEATSSQALFGSREAKGFPDVSVYVIQWTGDIRVNGPLFNGTMATAHFSVGRSIVPVSSSEEDFHPTGSGDNFPPRDLSTLGTVHRIELDSLPTAQAAPPR